MTNFDTDKPYSAFICTGRGQNYRESGSYTVYGTGYRDAARKFAASWNRNSFKVYGEEWKRIGRRKRMPKCHLYLRDELGNRLLLMPRSH